MVTCSTAGFWFWFCFFQPKTTTTASPASSVMFVYTEVKFDNARFVIIEREEPDTLLKNPLVCGVHYGERHAHYEISRERSCAIGLLL